MSTVDRSSALDELETLFPGAEIHRQETCDGISTLWVPAGDAPAVLRYLKEEALDPFPMLFDLTAIDERARRNRNGQPASDFTLIFHLTSMDRNEDLRIKVPLHGGVPALRTVTGIWPSANWYEREVSDMFGVHFEGHPNLRRILMPVTLQGHPLRKDHPARVAGTELEMEPDRFLRELMDEEEAAVELRPAVRALNGFESTENGTGHRFQSGVPRRQGADRLLRSLLELNGEGVLDAMPDAGFHHLGAEKLGERRSWRSYLPTPDQAEGPGEVVNDLAYLAALEKLARIEVPDRVQVIRVMMCELHRVASHLAWFGTFAQDIGRLPPVIAMFNDRERLFEIVEQLFGARMRPGWLRIGGVARDLPRGWNCLVRGFLDDFHPRLDRYRRMVLESSIFKARTMGVGRLGREEAIEWGITGPNLRASGLEWDLRKLRPYSGYEQFDFEVPISEFGDCYSRALVRVEEIGQSLYLIQQCLDDMPPGPIKAIHPLTVPRSMQWTAPEIETQIDHFLGVSRGPAIPPGEAMVAIETARGISGCYLVSDGDMVSYRTRIRSPSFPHLQALGHLTRGTLVPDRLATLESMDYAPADAER